MRDGPTREGTLEPEKMEQAAALHARVRGRAVAQGRAGCSVLRTRRRLSRPGAPARRRAPRGQVRGHLLHPDLPSLVLSPPSSLLEFCLLSP